MGDISSQHMPELPEQNLPRQFSSIRADEGIHSRIRLRRWIGGLDVV